MIDVFWMGAIALVAGAASYVSRVIGLACIVLAIVVAVPLWGLAAGSPVVFAAIVIPAIVSFVVGRLVKKAKATT
ncbi:MAG: hypothetical protein ACR2KH_01630 [Sphingomicrobium sp.]